MRPLFLVVEGVTEEAFTRSLLVPHLARFQIHATPIVVTTRRDRDGRKRRGGGDWTKWRADIRRLCKDSRSDLRITTMFDLYGLPENFPGLDMHRTVTDTIVRCELLQQAMATDIKDERFLPYLQRHEFEALVLAGLHVLDSLLEEPEDRAGLERLKKNIGEAEPENINDSGETAPSKRLARFIPSYNPMDGHGKPFFGELVTVGAGLPFLRERCPRFSTWVASLEQLGLRS